MVITALLLGACADGTAPSRARPVHPEPGPTPAPFAAFCRVQPDNALRVDCSVQVEPPGPVSVTFGPADGSRPERTVRSELALADHLVTLSLLPPSTPLLWTASAEDSDHAPISGAVTTGPLPARLGLVEVTAEGTSTAGAIGFASPCSEEGTVLVVDPQSGEVIWYQDLATSGVGFLEAATFTDRGTVLGIAGGALLEVDRGGSTLWTLRSGEALRHRVHHDVFRRDDRVYALFHELVDWSGTTLLVDGFYVVDGDGAEVLGEWHLRDHVGAPLDPVPTGTDWSHANGLWVGEDGDALISLRHLSAVLRVAADPRADDFGAVRWTLAAPSSALRSDLALHSEIGPPEDFQQQHNAFLLPDGRLTLFDNRLDPTEPSRVLEIAVEPGLGRATLERAYDLSQHCEFQGGALRTPAGNPLATCAPTSEGVEFDAATGEPTYRIHVGCGSQLGGYVPRFNPVTW